MHGSVGRGKDIAAIGEDRLVIPNSPLSFSLTFAAVRRFSLSPYGSRQIRI